MMEHKWRRIKCEEELNVRKNWMCWSKMNIEEREKKKEGERKRRSKKKKRRKKRRERRKRREKDPRRMKEDRRRTVWMLIVAWNCYHSRMYQKGIKNVSKGIKMCFLQAVAESLLPFLSCWKQYFLSTDYHIPNVCFYIQSKC